jgi:DNA polymerase V
MNKQGNVLFISNFLEGLPLIRPLFSTRVPAGFPAPVEGYIEEGIDLNRELVRHPPMTFYVKATGDSMCGVGIYPNSLLVVDRAETAKDGHIIIARIGDELCVKRLSFGDDGSIWLISENDFYEPIQIKPDDDFEIWGRVIFILPASAFSTLPFESARLWSFRQMTAALSRAATKREISRFRWARRFLKLKSF